MKTQLFFLINLPYVPSLDHTLTILPNSPISIERTVKFTENWYELFPQSSKLSQRYLIWSAVQCEMCEPVGNVPKMLQVEISALLQGPCPPRGVSITPSYVTITDACTSCTSQYKGTEDVAHSNVKGLQSETSGTSLRLLTALSNNLFINIGTL